jgi:hypothetical protein
MANIHAIAPAIVQPKRDSKGTSRPLIASAGPVKRNAPSQMTKVVSSVMGMLQISAGWKCGSEHILCRSTRRKEWLGGRKGCIKTRRGTPGLYGFLMRYATLLTAR